MSSSKRPHKQLSDNPSLNILKGIRKFDFSKLGLLGLGLLSLGLIVGIGLGLYNRAKVHRLTVVAGAAQGESFILSKAIESVVERHHPNIEITVQETGGTSENLKLLENNQAQIATAQADVSAGAAARIVSVLYLDKFQLIVRIGSGVQRFSDLQGKRIALPKAGGQFRSFLDVASHFGLQESDFTFVGATEQESNEAFLRNQADAVFRVRAMGNPSILTLVKTGGVQFVSIEQAAAMKIKYPAFEPSTIPQGAYRGNPPIPAVELPTVAVQRTLLAHRNVDNEVIEAITRILAERRQEVADAIAPESADVRPLVAGITRPTTDSGLGAPIHPGAQAYYDRDQPSFIQENADLLALILTVGLLLGSWTWELKRFIERQQKNQGDTYRQEVINLMHQVSESKTLGELEAARQSLLDILTNAVQALDKDLLSEESFQSFRAVWQIAIDVVRERRVLLVQGQQRTTGSH